MNAYINTLNQGISRNVKEMFGILKKKKIEIYDTDFTFLCPEYIGILAINYDYIPVECNNNRKMSE